MGRRREFGGERGWWRGGEGSEGNRGSKVGGRRRGGRGRVSPPPHFLFGGRSPLSPFPVWGYWRDELQPGIALVGAGMVGADFIRKPIRAK